MPHVPIDHGSGSDVELPLATYFARKLAFVRDPGGGSASKGPTEDAYGMRAAGFHLVAFNVGDAPPERWETWRVAARRVRLAVGVWARTHHAADIDRLIAAAHELRADYLIANLEQEHDEPRWRMSAAWAAETLCATGLPVAVSSEPWLPDNFAWAAFNHRGVACLPQLFGMHPPEHLIDRAHRWFRHVYPTCGAFPGSPPATVYRDALPAGLPYSVYSSDDVPDWRAWTW